VKKKKGKKEKKGKIRRTVFHLRVDVGRGGQKKKWGADNVCSPSLVLKKKKKDKREERGTLRDGFRASVPRSPLPASDKPKTQNRAMWKDR